MNNIVLLLDCKQIQELVNVAQDFVANVEQIRVVGCVETLIHSSEEPAIREHFLPQGRFGFKRQYGDASAQVVYARPVFAHHYFDESINVFA